MRKVYCDLCGNEIELKKGETVYGNNCYPGKDLCLSCLQNTQCDEWRNKKKLKEELIKRLANYTMSVSMYSPHEYTDHKEIRKEIKKIMEEFENGKNDTENV